MVGGTFGLLFTVVPLLIAGFAFAMAAFPRKLMRWQVRSPEGTSTIEPSDARIRLTRVAAVVVGLGALGMAFAGQGGLGGPMGPMGP
jgi:hypothetical protein